MSDGSQISKVTLSAQIALSSDEDEVMYGAATAGLQMQTYISI